MIETRDGNGWQAVKMLK